MLGKVGEWTWAGVSDGVQDREIYIGGLLAWMKDSYLVVRFGGDWDGWSYWFHSFFVFFSKRGNYWREPRWHWVGTDYLCMLWYFQFGLRAKIKSRLRKLRLTIIGWFSIIATLVKAWVARWVKTAMSKVRILLVVPLARKIRIFTFSINAKCVYMRFCILVTLWTSDGLYWVHFL